MFFNKEPIYYTVSAETWTQYHRFGESTTNPSSFVVVLADKVRWKDNKTRVDFYLQGCIQLQIHHSKARVIRRATAQEICDFQIHQDRVIDKKTEQVTALRLRDEQLANYKL